jgi:hypothetical protein
MKSTKQLGVWMDHTTANLIVFSNQKIVKRKMELIPAFPDSVENLRMDETLMNNKKENHISDFYQKISNVIKDYDEVLLYGPTNAKTELFNQLKGDLNFDRIKIDVQPADKMTENQQEAFFKKYFDTY